MRCSAPGSARSVSATLCESSPEVGLAERRPRSIRAMPSASRSSRLMSSGRSSSVSQPAAQPDEAVGEAQDVGVALDRGPVEPAQSGRRGRRRCCCRPASGAPRRPSAASGRRATSRSTTRKLLDLAAPQRLDRRVVGRALDAAVPAEVLVVAVAVALAVRLVVLRVVRDEVVEREAVVAGHEVDAGLRLAVACGRRCPGCRGSAGMTPGPCRGSPLTNAADVVAEAAVPLDPAVADEAADLVQAAGVPGLGDQLRAGQDRVGLDVPE